MNAVAWSQGTTTDRSHPPDFWRRLLHRWFVEYNPLYLLSAALVLAGINLISYDLRGSSLAALGVAGVAELYAWTLIGGAAWLTRIGLKRPAVMLALLCVLYQGDLTLHTETCAYLGTAGLIGVGMWIGSFIAKLHALAWAIRLRLSRSSVALASLGAVVLATLPRALSALSSWSGTGLVAVALFSLSAGCLWSVRPVTSRVALDAWGERVLCRARRATWLSWGLITLAHAAFWIGEYDLDPSALIPAAALLGTRFTRREETFWGVVFGTLAMVLVGLPAWTSVTALMATLAIGLRWFRTPLPPHVETRSPGPAYRHPIASPAPPESTNPRFGPAPATTRVRLAAGALTTSYLAVWTLNFGAGPFPEHQLWLDAVLTLSLTVLALRRRAVSPLIPLATNLFHLGVVRQVICAPKTIVEWGLAAVGSGFALLLISLVTAWRVSKWPPTKAAPDGELADTELSSR